MIRPVGGESQPCEDEAEVVADSGENGVGRIALAAFEIAAAEMAIHLHVPDHSLDGGAATQLAFDKAKDAALSLCRHRDFPAVPWCGARTDRRERGHWWWRSRS